MIDRHEKVINLIFNSNLTIYIILSDNRLRRWWRKSLFWSRIFIVDFRTVETLLLNFESVSTLFPYFGITSDRNHDEASLRAILLSRVRNGSASWIIISILLSKQHCLRCTISARHGCWWLFLSLSSTIWEIIRVRSSGEEDWITLTRNSLQSNIVDAFCFHHEVSIFLVHRVVWHTNYFLSQSEGIESKRFVKSYNSRGHTESIKVIDILSWWEEICKLEIRSYSDVEASVVVMVRVWSKDCNWVINIMHSSLEMFGEFVPVSVEGNFVGENISKECNRSIFFTWPPRIVLVEFRIPIFIWDDFLMSLVLGNFDCFFKICIETWLMSSFKGNFVLAVSRTKNTDENVLRECLSFSTSDDYLIIVHTISGLIIVFLSSRILVR